MLRVVKDGFSRSSLPGLGATVSSPAIRQLQEALVAAGQTVTVDSVLGPQTTAAVNALLGSSYSVAEVGANVVELTARVAALKKSRWKLWLLGGAIALTAVVVISRLAGGKKR